MAEMDHEERLALCQKVLTEKRKVLHKIDQVVGSQQAVLKKEIEVYKVLSNCLKRERDLAVKETTDKENVDPAAKVKKSTPKEMGAAGCSDKYPDLLRGLKAELSRCQSELVDISQRSSALQKSEKAVSEELANVERIRAWKHKELTNFTREHCSESTFTVPEEVLHLVFALLDTEDLVTVGQVCQRWRDVSRSEESLWSNRRLTLNSFSRSGLRVLHAAPFLGHLEFNQTVRRHVRETKCKILGMSITGFSSIGYFSVLKKNSEHLKSLTLDVLNRDMAFAVSDMHLEELNLRTYYGMDVVVFPTNVQSSLVKLRVSGAIRNVTLMSLLKPHSATLRQVNLGKFYCIPASTLSKEELISALAQCSQLEELWIPLCFNNTVDFSKSSFKVDRLTVSASWFCDNVVYGVVRVAPHYIFAPDSVAHLRIHIECVRLDMFAEMANFVKRLPRAFRATLKSISFDSVSTPNADLSILLQSVIEAIPEFRGKWKLNWCK